MSPFKFGFTQGSILTSPNTMLEDNMELGEQLGKGHFGVVRACKDKKTGERLACKSIRKSKLKCWEEREDVRREAEIMEVLGNHPNIVSLRATYEDEDSVHLILDRCEGGELFDEISFRGPLSEKRAAQVTRGIAKAVSHCHSRGIFHRDLKPENVLLVHRSGDQRNHLDVKLADFGLSLKLREGQTVHGLAGSPYYLAPEVLSGSYGHPADVWSLGVVLYMMLSETAPFYGESEKEICASIAKADLQFVGSVWDQVSEEAKDLIRWMLQRDPAKRPSAMAILQHPWVLEHTQEPEECVSTTYIQRSCSSAQPSTSATVDLSSPSQGLGIQPCQSLPRGSTQTRDLLQWLSPQLAGAQGEQGISSTDMEPSPLLQKFNEALADLEDGIHYFVLDDVKEDDCCFRGGPSSEVEASPESATVEGTANAELPLQQGLCRPSEVMKSRNGYEPTPLDVLDWIFGL